MEEKSIFIAHNDIGFIHNLKEEFEYSVSYHLDDYALTSADLNEKILEKEYDLLIVKDSILDAGLMTLNTLLNRMSKRPKRIIVLLSFISEYIISKAYEIGIDYISTAEINSKTLFNIIYHINKDVNLQKNKHFNLEYEIKHLLEMLGLKTRYVGYKYLSTILHDCYKDKNILNHGVMMFYKVTAEKYGVSKASVERAIRTCLKRSLEKQYNYFAHQLLGYDYFVKNTPSNSYVIQASIKYLREQNVTIINKLLWNEYNENEGIA
ncbi:sporulation transcriptional activator Spo0A [Haloplasma contractile]|uniref:Chey-like receiver domain containing protein YCBB n=1 Tax=Haloplasma contractile SSD-17B TaxID=1033810 RepID=U2FME8_9MOLU|nr:sporulation transcriptional activator Spo0A [Haloplasma contractile]ERJ12344.1 Chey-like receiver domain containing protein YCBB [Haloplasma contractile SSD-17B]